MPRDRINCCAESWLPPKSTDYDVKWPCWYALARLKYFQIFDMIGDGALMQSFVGFDPPLVLSGCRAYVGEVNGAISDITLLNSGGV